MKRTLIGVAALLAAVVAAAALALRGSLPVLDGERAVPGLGAPVTVERDRLGVPTVRGRTRADVAHATGFLHAQDRFFQMDLLRRVAAGEISALVGPGALEVDRRHRVHGLRGVAGAVVAGLAPEERAVLDAYVAGVAAGLEALAMPPPEYLLLRSRPTPWRPEDTILAVLAMSIRLSDPDAADEMRRGLLAECVPGPVATFLSSHDPEWAAPVDGGILPRAPLPPPSVYDLRTLAGAGFGPDRSFAETLAFDAAKPDGASNAWVVAGSRTAHGGAIAANDMHLGIGLPNVWYRMRLVVEGGGEPDLDVTGVTLPGTPAVAAGSNRRVAWGFTNSYGDWSDRVRVRIDSGDPERYLTPDGPRRFRVREERIDVAGADPVRLPVRETIWGPVVADPLGHPVAIRWTGHDPEATNLGLLAFERAASVRELLDIAPGVGIPPQNVTVADREGHIGWTVAGRIPRRVAHDPSGPTDGASAPSAWNGWLSPEDYPRLVDPPGGLIWTANHPVVTGDALALIGDSGYWHGARARQIRDGLRSVGRATEADQLRVQLDDRALLLARWKTLLLAVLDTPGAVPHPRTAEFREAVAAGNGRASADAADYRLVHAFRARVRDVVFGAITAPCRALLPGYRFAGFRQDEGPLWRLLTERPPHLLHPGYPDWDALLATVAGDTVAHFADGFAGPFAARTWGEHNLHEVRHPLTRAVSALGRVLNIAPAPMAGDRNMPRVMAFGRGASERFGVSPGREERGYLHMPGGQSGHFLSPYYRAGHGAWVRGEATPFLPGIAAHTLRLIPGRE